MHNYDTKLQFYGNMTLSYNTVSDSAGAIYHYRREVTYHYRSTGMLMGNTKHTKGGGIYAIVTTILVWANRISLYESSLLLGNQAQRGGGMHVLRNSL